MTQKYIILLSFFLLYGCVGYINIATLTPEDRSYLERAMAFPLGHDHTYGVAFEREMPTIALEFLVPKSEEDEVWTRAQIWIAQYSSMKLLIVTDIVLETSNPVLPEAKFGYSVFKMPMKDEVKFIVKCFYGNPLYSPAPDRNAHILSWYMKSGENIPEMITR